MSYTEIYEFKKGEAEFSGEVRNAFRGAMSIWQLLEETYLGLIPATWEANKMVSRCVGFGVGALNDIWNLADDPKVEMFERIVMMSTFDNVLVKKENIPTLLDSFKKFDEKYPEQTNLSEQISIIEQLLEDEEVTAIGWNQTSVNADTWSNKGGYDEETDETIPYNYETMEEHWFLFDDFKK